MENICSKSIFTKKKKKNCIVKVQHIITATITRIFQILMGYFLGHYNVLLVSLAGGSFGEGGLTLLCLQSQKAWDALSTLI